jgi:hypothetical protein
LGEYVNLARSLREEHAEIKNNEDMSLKAFEKFKKCRTEASQNSLKKSKNIILDVLFPLFRFTTCFRRTWRLKSRISSKESGTSPLKNHSFNSKRCY